MHSIKKPFCFDEGLHVRADPMAGLCLISLVHVGNGLDDVNFKFSRKFELVFLLRTLIL